MSSKRAVVAIGGNSLIRDREHQTVKDQYVAAGETCWHIASMIKDGWEVAIGHGNGPQVGFILRRSELAAHELHEVPLDVCGADSQGAIGYALAQNLENDFRRLGIDKHAVPSSPRPRWRPTTRRSRTRRSRSARSWTRRRRCGDATRTAGRSSRTRAAAGAASSPPPRRCASSRSDAIRTLIDAGFVVICVGGGGIPVVADENGDLIGVAAVIDKDLASRPAREPDIDAELLDDHHRRREASPSTSERRSSAGSTG